MTDFAQTVGASALPRPFWRYWLGLLASALGDAVVYVALPFLALGTLPPGSQRGAAAIGLVVLALSLPRFFAPLLGGLADRWPPRTLLSLSAVLRTVGVAGVGALALRGGLNLTVVAGLAFVLGLLTTLSFTAQSAMVPRLVTPHQLPRANSLTSAAMMGAPLVGYGLGGFGVAHWGAGASLLVGAALTALLLLGTLALPPMPGAAGGTLDPLGDLRSSLKAIRQNPLLLALFAMSFALNLSMNVTNVRAPLHMLAAGRGAADYATFEMLISGGVLLGIALVGPLSARFPLDKLIGAGRLILVLGMAGFVFGGVQPWWAAAGVFGVGLGLLEVVTTTRIQGLIPADLRGRVTGSVMAVNALGLTLGAGLAAQDLATSTLMLALTGVLALLTLLWPLAVRRLGS
ncbi:MFS transporter [Deinococcus detaillensis]|uniref:MFS transporter n=1 Tax=Deinococcus detaillensis TaxID=2592048 RepID=A0A553V5E3_9DEIO|nr:MFS transporter [Deinococcus detaillensis]TSA87700.1 MFS transporter [Deinococcus detaillensis]